MGRVVVPKAIRARLQLHGGEVLEVEKHDGVVELRPAPAEVRVIESPEGPVVEPLLGIPPPPLTDEMVRNTMERTRR